MPIRFPRRTFLASAGSLALGGLIPSGVLGANDRITLGVIGCGARGLDHIRSLRRRKTSENIAFGWLSDVYVRRLNRGRDLALCNGSVDYRRMLDRRDIDAVFVVTPDHWHAKMAVDALEAGKHVYVEKPMTRTIPEALAMRDTAIRTGLVCAVGPNDTARDVYRKGRDIIRGGRIGRVTFATGGTNRNIRGGAWNTWYPIDETAGPGKEGDDAIDWDMWLGHQWGLAPKIPWNPAHFFRFRKYHFYSGGVATDLLYHVLAPLLITLAGDNGAYPWRVSAGGGLYLSDDGRDVPDVFTMQADYPREFSVQLESILTNNTPRPPAVYGRFGTMYPDNPDGLLIEANGDYASEFRQRNGGYARVVVPAENGRDMQQNFFDAIRRGVRPWCTAELGTATMVAIKMAVDSCRRSKTLLWDGATETVHEG